MERGGWGGEFGEGIQEIMGRGKGEGWEGRGGCGEAAWLVWSKSILKLGYGWIYGGGEGREWKEWEGRGRAGRKGRGKRNTGGKVGKLVRMGVGGLRRREYGGEMEGKDG